MSFIRIRVFVRLAVIAAVLAAPAQSFATPIVDQSYIPLSGPGEGGTGIGLVISDGQGVAQTFTVGITGLLTALELKLGCCRFGLPEDDLLVEIRPTLADGSPGDTTLASITLEPTQLPSLHFAFVHLALGDEKFFVNEGELLSIVLTTSATVVEGGGINPYAWGGDGQGLYENGMVYTKVNGQFLETGWDLGFVTYVDAEVPEPGLVALMGIGLLAAGRQHHARRRRGADSR
jgi:hypothetical protein